MHWRLATAVVLSAATLNGCTCEQPNPALHVSPSTTVQVNQTVTLDSRRIAGDPDDYVDEDTNYEWDLDGDGTFETQGGQSQQTSFRAPGTYDVTLNESNAFVPDSIVTQTPIFLHGYKTVPIVVTAAPGGGPAANKPPTASFTATPNPGYTERAISFDGSGSSDSDGTIGKYEWDWEADGTYDQTGTSPAATHSYPFAGTYTVRLRVTDDDGATGTTENTVQVMDGVPPGRVLARESGGASAAGAGVPFTLRLSSVKATPGTTTVGGARLITAGVRAHGRFRLTRAPRILGRHRSIRWAASLAFTQKGNRAKEKASGKGYLLLALSRRSSVCLAAKAAGSFKTFSGRLAVAGGTGRGGQLRGTGTFKPPALSAKHVLVKGRLKLRQVGKRRALPKACRSLARALP